MGLFNPHFENQTWFQESKPYLVSLFVLVGVIVAIFGGLDIFLYGVTPFKLVITGVGGGLFLLIGLALSRI